MWTQLIGSLDLDIKGDVVVAGRNASAIELPAVRGERTSSGSLTLYSSDDMADPAASASDTMLRGNSAGLVLLNDAFGSVADLKAVLHEAYRILVPGGQLLITEFNVTELLESAPQRFPQRILTRMFPHVATYLLDRHPTTIDIAIELVRTGFKDADAYMLDKPIGRFHDYAEHADFVLSGGWRGVEALTDEERADLVTRLPAAMKSARPSPNFDDLEPITVADGHKPI